MAEPNWKNRTLFHEDNLEIMQGMNDNTVDLIATDPPFNKGKDFSSNPETLKGTGGKFQDRWKWDIDVHPIWKDQIKDAHPQVWHVIDAALETHSESMAAFCCFMAIRLQHMQRILKPTGSIYLQCDTTANSYIRLLMDAIFGAKNFRNEIVWHRSSAPKENQYTPRGWGAETDSIFFYSKTSAYYFNALYDDYTDKYIDKNFKYIDEETGKRYSLVTLLANSGSAGKRPNLVYDVFGHTRTWAWKKEKTEDAMKKGLIVQKTPGGMPYYKRFLEGTNGTRIQSLWKDIPPLSPSAKERTKYPTQKPVALYARIIEASCPEEGVVFDPFAGCATTCVAAERSDRQWVGIDLWEGSYELTKGRMENECWNLLGEPLGNKKVHGTSKPPKRTDECKDDYMPSFKLEMQRPGEGNKTRQTREEMVNILIERHGLQCQGCFRTFEFKEYFHLDHILPKTDGGTNELENRTLLCGPCNSIKGRFNTLSGLHKILFQQKRMSVHCPDKIYKKHGRSKNNYIASLGELHI